MKDVSTLDFLLPDVRVGGGAARPIGYTERLVLRDRPRALAESDFSPNLYAHPRFSFSPAGIPAQRARPDDSTCAVAPAVEHRL